jgi:hypothetical protein
MWLLLVWVSLVSAAPWASVSQITRQACQGTVCRPAAGQREPQVHQVQTFGTAEECLTVREQMMQRVAEAEGPVNRLVEARHPTWSLRLRPTFVCLPDTETMEDQVR